MVKSKSRLVARRRRALSGRRLRARGGVKTGRRSRALVGVKTRGRPPHPNPKVVKEAERIFAGMGMTGAEAVALFYKQTALRGDFPITELIPNEETQEAIWDALAGIGIKEYASVAEMRADLLQDG